MPLIVLESETLREDISRIVACLDDAQNNRSNALLPPYVVCFGSVIWRYQYSLHLSSLFSYSSLKVSAWRCQASFAWFVVLSGRTVPVHVTLAACDRMFSERWSCAARVVRRARLVAGAERCSVRSLCAVLLVFRGGVLSMFGSFACVDPWLVECVCFVAVLVGHACWPALPRKGGKYRRRRR